MSRKVLTSMTLVSILILVMIALAFVACSGFTKPLDDAFEVPESIETKTPDIPKDSTSFVDSTSVTEWDTQVGGSVVFE